MYGCSKGEDAIETPDAAPAPEISGKLLQDKTAIMRVQKDFIDDIAKVGDKWDAYGLSLRADLSEYYARQLNALDEVISTPKGKLLKDNFLELLNRHHVAASNWSDTLGGLQDVEERLRLFKEEGEGGATVGSVSERTARQIELLKEKRDLQVKLTGREQTDILDIEHEIEKLFEISK